MKSTWFRKPEHYQFAKHLSIPSLGIREVFDDFLACSYLAMSQAATKLATGAIDAAEEHRYLSVIQKHPAYAEALPKALARLVVGLEQEEEDFLGDVSASIGANDVAFKGQCFTPYSVCRVVAEMSLEGTTRGPSRLLLNEPACGGGAMVMATAAVLRDRGFSPSDYYFVATDVDVRCFHMTYIQLTLLDIPATVVWGNTLTLEEYKAMPTFAGVRHPWKREEPPSKESADSTGSTIFGLRKRAK